MKTKLMSRKAPFISSRSSASAAIVLATLIGAAPPCFATPSMGAVPLHAVPKREREQVESELKSQLQKLMNVREGIAMRGRTITVIGVTADPVSSGLTINLSKAFLLQDADFRARSGFISLNLQRQIKEIEDSIAFHLGEKYRYSEVRLLIEGRDIYDFYPESRREIEHFREQKARRSAERHATATSNTVVDTTVMMNPGHGYAYYYGDLNSWELQRPLSNGVQEDFITQNLAADLRDALFARTSAANVFSPRSESQTIYAASGKPWVQMAARYFLKEILPAQTGIWHSRPTDTSKNREEYEDINSRPYYANYLNVDAMISIHTNASPDSAIRGTAVYYATGDTEGQKLGDRILCSMKETIQALPSYNAFPVRTSAIASTSQGENSLATMPAVIVEAAFHTNPSDAAALKDMAFRAAAMKGVAKGYRIYSEGKSCAPFKIDSIPNVTTAAGTTVQGKTFYSGNPQFPVKRKSTVVSCPTGWSCTGGESTHSSGASPLVYSVNCGTVPASGTMRFSVALTDADGVKTVPVEYSLTCTK